MKTLFEKKLKECGVKKTSNILLALSGGVDSMVLLNLFMKTGVSFSIAHCNFCLRGKESDEDEAFVRLFSNQNNIPLYVKSFDTLSYAKENKISIQMAARSLRYKWFYTIKKKYSFCYIATAHHYTDSVETVLINLIRGTGISGLHGINNLPNLIRPLLSFSKNDILNYAKKNAIVYREDSSNQDDKYIRNKVRNRIIPIMQEINPNVLNSIGSTIMRLRDVERIYNQFIFDKKSIIISKIQNEYRINIEILLQEPSSKQILYEIISDFGFFDIDSVFNSLSSKSGKEFFNSDFYMVKDRRYLIISDYINNNREVVSDEVRILKQHKLQFEVTQMNDYSYFIKQANLKLMHIDYDKLQFPLMIRPWQKGDSFIPLGMSGVKKVSDYFIDNKFSLIKKKKARLLISNNQIVCIIGERLDERFKLVQESKKIYIVKSL